MMKLNVVAQRLLREDFSKTSVARRLQSTRGNFQPKISDFGSVEKTIKTKPPKEYHMNDDLAKIVAQHLVQDIKEKRHIMELNPGPRHLTDRILKMGCQNLHLYEPASSFFFEKLENFARYNTSVKLYDENLLHLQSMLAKDRKRKVKRASSCFKDLPRQDIHKPPIITLVAKTHHEDKSFFHSLIHAAAKQSQLFHLGKVDLLLILLEREYHMMSRTTGRRKDIVALYQHFFNWKHLHQFRSPGLTRHLVRLTLKTDVHDQLASKDLSHAFVHFIKQSYARAADLLYFNELLPNATRHVLLKTRWKDPEQYNLRPQTKIGSLPLQVQLDLFQAFTQHEKYPENALEKYRLADQDKIDEIQEIPF